MLIQETLTSYVELVDSELPAPGGGSVAGYVGAVGAALGRMYGHLSIHKKAFAKWDESTQSNFMTHFDHLQQLQEKMLKVVDEDAALYPKVVAAYKLPKITDEEKAIRHDAIQAALKLALEGPLEMAQTCVEGLETLEHLIPYGNAGVASDAACSVIFMVAACEATLYNVKINLQSIEDEAYCAINQKAYDEIVARLPILKEQLLMKCEKRMAGE